MEEILNAMVGAVASEAIALGELTDQVRALKMTLARRFPQMADELRGQMEAEQERSRNDAYELQVSLARVREAIAAVPEADAEAAPEKKRKPGKRPGGGMRVGPRRAMARK